MIELELPGSGQLNKKVSLYKTKPSLFEDLKNCKPEKIFLKTLHCHCPLTDLQANDSGLSRNAEFAYFSSFVS